MDKKIRFTNNILPIYSALSSDLLFWIAINSLYLSNDKGFSASQISLLSSISALSALFMMIFANKIIKTIGNKNSIILGTFMLLVASLLLTFSNSYYLFIIAYCLYSCAFLFKNMDSVILERNLRYTNRINDYLHIRSIISFIYAFTTMAISFVASRLYNYSPYLPMYLCIGVCVFNFITSFFITTAPIVDKTTTNKSKLELNPIILFVFITCVFSFPIIDSGMSQVRLYMQYRLANYYTTNKVADLLFLVIAFSRIVRTICSFIFSKINKRKDIYYLLPIISILLVLAFILIITSEFINITIFKFILITIGYFILIGTRDAFSNMTNSLLLQNCNDDAHEKAILYNTILSKFGSFTFNLIISLLLINHDIFSSLIMLGICTLVNVCVLTKLYNLTK